MTQPPESWFNIIEMCIYQYRKSQIVEIRWSWDHLNILLQDCSNSIANTMELLQFCTKPSILSSQLDFL